ncbi:MAG: class I SAM-dependent rRNA methyltransferase [Thermodesulfobacteriota bacterium]
MDKPIAILTPKGERWLRSGHPWIFRDDILTLNEAENGEVVSLLGGQKNFLGRAFYSRHSRITFRLISSTPQIIDQSYWVQTLQKALEARKELLGRDQACRLVFSEADNLPGLIADWYAGHLVIQTMIPGTDLLLSQFGNIFQELLHPESILIRNDLEARSLEHLPQEIRVFAGKVPEKILVREGDVRYWVDLLKGQKTGAYLDQRENRLHLISYKQSRGRVLDCFCYTGNFALHLARGAGEVLAIDDSAPALEWGKKNAEQNGFPNISFQKKNAFDFLKEAEEQGQRFDMIILDPPPFARRKPAVSAALRGYQELNRRALKCLNPGGVLSTFSCSYHITEPLFQDLLAHSAQKAGGRFFLLEKRMQARDHPILLNFPESHYLKGLILQVA